MAESINLSFGDMDGGYPNAINGSTNAITDNSNTFYLDAGKVAAYADIEFYDLQSSILPSNATIAGIEVRILNAGYNGGSGTATFDCELFHPSTPGYSNTISTEISNTHSVPGDTIIIGDETEKWGKTWTYADLYDSNFKVHFDNVVESGVTIAMVATFVFLRVYYESPVSGLLNLDSGLVQLNDGLITI
tara:strand:- start:4467 stop:5036 length:570 start_codon:yes stop_codon:yes gene_type:complete